MPKVENIAWIVHFQAHIHICCCKWVSYIPVLFCFGLTSNNNSNSNEWQQRHWKSYFFPIHYSVSVIIYIFLFALVIVLVIEKSKQLLHMHICCFISRVQGTMCEYFDKLQIWVDSSIQTNTHQYHQIWPIQPIPTHNHFWPAYDTL